VLWQVVIPWEDYGYLGATSVRVVADGVLLVSQALADGAMRVIHVAAE